MSLLTLQSLQSVATFGALSLSLLAIGGVANMAAVALGHRGPLARYDRPIWERGLGRNKTWRGLLVGLVVGAVAAPLVWLLAGFWIGLPFYWWVGPVVGLATMGGDAVTSGLKRRLRLQPGACHWTDSLDPAFGVFVGAAAIGLGLGGAALCCAVACLVLHYAHPLVSRLGFRAGCKAVPH